MVLNLEVNKKECKGEIYRCRISTFVDSKGCIVHNKKMIPMKRLSCKGDCEQYHITAELTENIETKTYDNSNCINGLLYKMVIKNESRDWETGQVDYWEIGFVIINKASDALDKDK